MPKLRTEASADRKRKRHSTSLNFKSHQNRKLKQLRCRRWRRTAQSSASTSSLREKLFFTTTTKQLTICITSWDQVYQVEGQLELTNCCQHSRRVDRGKSFFWKNPSFLFWFYLSLYLKESGAVQRVLSLNS